MSDFVFGCVVGVALMCFLLMSHGVARNWVRHDIAGECAKYGQVKIINQRFECKVIE